MNWNLHELTEIMISSYTESRTGTDIILKIKIKNAIKLIQDNTGDITF